MLKIAMATIFSLFLTASALCAQEIKNEYFSVDLPEGWETVKMPQQKGVPGVTEMFANKKINCAVSVSCADTAKNAKEVAEETRAKMMKGGIKAGELVEKDGIYSYPVQRGPAKGAAYYGSNGKTLAIVTIWAGDVEKAKPFFDALKPADPALFPKF